MAAQQYNIVSPMENEVEAEAKKFYLFNGLGV
jgi:hypothetical protein